MRTKILKYTKVSTFITVSVTVIFQLLIFSNFCECRALNTLNLTKSSKFSIESNSIQRDVVETQTNNDINRSLKRVFLSNRTVTCNDGSQAGFYLRKSPGAKRWVVFLEGGWHCFDIKSCRSRWLKFRHLMTSAQWPENRDVGGILSPLPEENPYWHNANHVLVPYCSSDSWSGTKTQIETRDGWRFMGSLIIKQVIADLIPLGLGGPANSELLLVGSSAGGLGVMLNLDRVSHFIHNEKNLKVLVRGVSDSGWFLDREPYTPGAVAASEGVRQGWKMWGGSLPEECVKHHLNEPWRCYFGYRLYPTLKSPLFVFQWLFDEAQMRADNVGAPVTPQQWDYIHGMGGALRQSLDNVTAVFAPSCIGHAVLSKRDWLNIKIDDISLPEALRCWEQSTRRKHNKLRRDSEPKRNDKKRRHNQKHNRQNNNQQNDGTIITSPTVEKKNKKGIDKNNGEQKKLTKEEREQRRRHNERRRKHRKLRESQKELKTVDGIFDRNSNITQKNGGGNKKRNKLQENFEENSPNSKHHKNGGNGKRKRKRKEQLRHQYRRDQEILSFGSRFTEGDDAKVILEPKKCSLRLLEKCSWPQCNYSCPTLTNPLTGEEMRFLELLASFGLDIEAVATAIGVDMQTLNNMDRTELVNLLTQQTS
ncbi:palmitoleoyl-protein carboxylesterase NOTUM [Condylostylus longicornis]|uniref:palmitoleoyl-protein carboxylesterase NOTUM n=1 Tax=Condylostylus longicornis TaxID=2530218 RepID=UPI00244E3354|nr:palmitoleoyl-protein carboxylesterase NOTUM [Condylostylus longicornis]